MGVTSPQPIHLTPPRFGAGGPLGFVTDTAAKTMWHATDALTILRANQKELTVDLRQLVLPILAGTALILIHGTEKAKGGDPNRWAKMLGESGVLYTLMAYTSGIMPLVGLGTAAYNAGDEPNLQGKVNEFLKTGAMIAAGWAGALVGIKFSKESFDVPLRQFYKAHFGEVSLIDRPQSPDLRDPAKQAAWQAKWNPIEAADRAKLNALQSPFHTVGAFRSLATATAPEDQRVAALLPQIRTGLAESKQRMFDYLVHLAHHGPKDQDTIQLLKGKVDEALEKLASQVGDPKIRNLIDDELKAMVEAGRPLAERENFLLDQFSRSLARNQAGYAKLARLSNPILGAMLAILVAGVPLYKGLARFAAWLFPGMKKEDIQLSTPLLWSGQQGGPSWQTGSYMSHGGGQYSGGYDNSIAPDGTDILARYTSFGSPGAAAH